MDSSDFSTLGSGRDQPPNVEKPFFPSVDSVRFALESGKIGVWSWDIGSDAITWSRNLESIHGLEPGSFDGSFAFFERDIHPEDQAAVSAAIREAVDTQKPYRVRYRLPKRINGEERWIEATGAFIDEAGTGKRMVGFCQAITDRITLDNELRGRGR